MNIHIHGSDHINHQVGIAVRDNFLSTNGVDKVAVNRMIIPLAAIFLQTRNIKETITVFESEVGQESVLTVTVCCPPTSPIPPDLRVGIMQTARVLCAVLCDTWYVMCAVCLLPCKGVSQCG